MAKVIRVDLSGKTPERQVVWKGVPLEWAQRFANKMMADLKGSLADPLLSYQVTK